MQNKEAIAALVEELKGLDQDKAFGVITTEQYWKYHQTISKQISKLRESQPSNFYSAEPTPEERKLVVLKNRVLFAIEPYKHRVASKDYHALQIALRFCTDTRQVETLYNTWQGKLRHKNIAELPDLNARPPQRKQTDLNQAA